MGVLGLIPFLQKRCPEAIRAIPDRFREFRGKTIVFDGTLITHRFHFAQTPHQYRHVLGWYRLISELKDNGVHAICVFDGPARSAAKAPENEKRRSARHLNVTRWSMEVERQRRLQTLDKLLKKYQVLPPEKRPKITFKEKDETDSDPRLPISLTYEDLDSELTQEDDDSNLPDDFIEYIEPPPILSAALKGVNTVIWPSEAIILDRDFPIEGNIPPSLTRDLPKQLSALYQSHKTSSKAFKAITSPTGVPGDSPEEVTESKNQLALTRDEDTLWSDIQSHTEQPLETRSKVSLASLISRSQLLVDSYERRCKPPTQETYAECKSILEAMGVPIVACRGSYEAEGLASSLVRKGHAHFVASEDTDVLVYGAPLLRNIASRNGAIYVLDSADIRRAFSLSRAAFTDFALLIGTDFTQRLRNVGPVRALSFITTHSRIERIVKVEKKYAPSDERQYLEEIRRARSVFTSLPPVPRKETLQPRSADKEKVIKLLNQFGLARAAVDSDWDPQMPLAGNYFADNPFGDLEGTATGKFEMHSF